MEARTRALLLILPLLIFAAAAVLFAEGQAAPRRAARAEDFSRLVGGPMELDPIPDGSVYPGSALRSSPWPNVAGNAPLSGGEAGDAFPP